MRFIVPSTFLCIPNAIRKMVILLSMTAIMIGPTARGLLTRSTRTTFSRRSPVTRRNNGDIVGAGSAFLRSVDQNQYRTLVGIIYDNNNKQQNSRIQRGSPLMMGRRRRRNDARGSTRPPRAIMQTPLDGVPEVAKVHPERYDELLAEKVVKMEKMIREVIANTDAISLNEHGKEKDSELPPTEVFESPRDAFRMRANFKIWRTGNKEEGYGSAHYVMFERGDNRTPHEVKRYPMGSQRLQSLMEPLLAAINDTDELGKNINDVRFLTTQTGEALITMTYNRPIGEKWCEAATILADHLQQQFQDDQDRISAAQNKNNYNGAVKFVGRSRKVKLVVGEDDTVNEILSVPGIDRDLRYRQTEGAFSQPSAKVCEKMLGWAYDATKTPIKGLHNNEDTTDGDDLCELYCGNGCFTVALASNFRRVVATEMSKASVKLAEHNLHANNVTNTRVARLNAEDFVQAYDGTRSFRRLHDAGIRIVGSNKGGRQEQLEDQNAISTDENSQSDTANNFKHTTDDHHHSDNDDDSDNATISFDRLRTLFVDPPRQGLDETCRRLAVEFDRIVYVSCNPETLARDLRELVPTHKVTRVAAFDQFPYTPHLEAGVVLERRT